MSSETPGLYDLTVYQSTDQTVLFQVLDAMETPILWTGYTAVAQAHAHFDSDEILFDLTTENGGVELQDDGWVQLIFAKEITDLIAKSGVWKLKLIQPTTGEIRLLEGKMILSKEAPVTKP